MPIGVFRPESQDLDLAYFDDLMAFRYAWLHKPSGEGKVRKSIYRRRNSVYAHIRSGNIERKVFYTEAGSGGNTVNRILSSHRRLNALAMYQL